MYYKGEATRFLPFFGSKWAKTRSKVVKTSFDVVKTRSDVVRRRSDVVNFETIFGKKMADLSKNQCDIGVKTSFSEKNTKKVVAREL
ncbi:MAG: hypothetical protein II200_02370 [Bacteroidaceae bacterium]|nr:hypothetical protein [Bacteroidaceae bacterium]